ncbi:MAG TPA: hypothetical protein VNL14_21220 [Candidatus Acidoferrales bacterium]|nr:hypothetical protein [Candidatus Acidoferrales bacterium]
MRNDSLTGIERKNLKEAIEAPAKADVKAARLIDPGDGRPPL